MLTWADVLYDLDYLGIVEATQCPSDKKPDDAERTHGAAWGFYSLDQFRTGQQKKPGVRGSFALNALMHYNHPGDKYADDPARQLYAVDG